MITIGQKIQELMNARGIRSLRALQKLIRDEFGANALSLSGISYLVRNDTKLHEKHILQLISILNISRKDFIHGTTLEDKLKIKTDTISVDSTPGKSLASYQLLSSQSPAALIKLRLKGFSRTRDEQDDGDLPEAIKYVGVAHGTLTIVIRKIDGEEKIRLNKGDGYALDSKQLHYFENMGPITTTAFITHFPLIASPFYYNPK